MHRKNDEWMKNESLKLKGIGILLLKYAGK
jgi:hypothetical protein